MQRILGAALVMEAALTLALAGQDATEEEIAAFATNAVAPSLRGDEALAQTIQNHARRRARKARGPET